MVVQAPPEIAQDRKPDDPPDSAVQTLRGEMLYFRDQGQALLDAIIEEFKKITPQRQDLIAQLVKYKMEAKKMSIDCAAKLAPYEAPRLESIEVKQKTITKFVIEAPSAIKDTNEWLQNAKKELGYLNKIKQDVIDIEDIPHARPVRPI